MTDARGPFRVEQAAAILGFHPDTVRDFCNRGLLLSTRTPGGHRRIAADALDAFVKHQLARYSRAA